MVCGKITHFFGNCRTPGDFFSCKLWTASYELLGLLNGRLLILTAAVTVVLVGDTLLFDVVYQFYTALLDRSGSGDVFVRLGRTLIHREGNVRGAGADALVLRHCGYNLMQKHSLFWDLQTK